MSADPYRHVGDLFQPSTDAERVAFRAVQHGVGNEWRRIGKEEVRRRILEAELATVICWRHSSTRRPRRYDEAFEDVFGEPLVATSKRKRPAT